MLADQFLEAAAAARNSTAMDETARLLWRAHAEGHIADADAEAVSEALQARRAALAWQGTVSLSKPALARRRTTEPRSPDRQASLERRRRQAMSGVVPAKIAASFTLGELAVLSIVGRQCQKGGTCSLPIDAIAALAGVSRRTAQTAMRAAGARGLIHIRERRRRGLPSLTNIITVISKGWTAWLKLNGEGIGCKNLHATNNSFFLIAEGVDKPRRRQGLHWRFGTRSDNVPSQSMASTRGREAAK